MKKQGNKSLTWNDRLQLESLLKAEVPKKKIAEMLGVCLSTVYNEIKRGQYNRLDGSTWLYEKVYSPDKAQRLTDYNKSARGPQLKVGNDFQFVRYVENRVKCDGVSACAVLGEIKRKKMPFVTDISKTTLYRYIRIGIFQNLSMENLQTKKKHYQKVKAKKVSRGTSIEKRPKEINARNSFGHWEMDCVCGNTLPALLCLTERYTRKEIIFKMKDQTSESVIRCLNILEKRYGKMFGRVFRSITVDNGSEFANCKGMTKSRYNNVSRTTFYYCHPYSSCERGTNERLNREIRRKIPKGSNIAHWSEEKIKEIESWINRYPREVLDFDTSEERFEAELLKLNENVG